MTLTGFRNIIILSSTLSPIKRERDSNRQIPEIFAYVNNYLYKKTLAEGKSYYDKYSIKKFGYYLGESKRKSHQELSEMMGEGAAGKLIKVLNKFDLPVELFIIYTPGGVDFVGGYTYYNFLKNSIDANGEANKDQSLGKVNMIEKSGEEIHKKLFEDKLLKTPEHWK